MTTINPANKLVTLMNVFTVAPENQEKLVQFLIKATRETMNKLPGYISANIHKSLDGVRVLNYAQWRSKEDFEAIFANPEFLAHMKEAEQIAISYEPHLYEVSFVDERPL